MSDFNGFRAYESAIIGGMLASGRHNLESVRDNFRNIRQTARKFSGAVSEVHYPTGVCWEMTDAARRVLYSFLDIPKPLGKAILYLEGQGFEERVIRYTISANMGVYANVFDLNIVDGVRFDMVMLSRAVQK